MIRITGAFLFLLSMLPQRFAAQSCTRANVSTTHGERLDYKIYYTLAGAYIGAGETRFTNQLETLDGQPVWHVMGQGRTFPSYDWFFKVRDTYESYIDTLSMKPRRFVRNVSEGGNRIYNRVLFDHARGSAVSTNGVFPIGPCVQDVLSVIYHARNIDFSKYTPGQKIPLELFLDDKVWPVYIRYLGRETLHTMYGDYRTIKFRPLLIEGTIFRGGEKMEVWVTDDANRVPVFVHTPILVGSIKAYLRDYAGLRNAATGIISSKKRN